MTAFLPKRVNVTKIFVEKYIEIITRSIVFYH